MLEAGRINLVPPPELGLSGCDFCGEMYQEGREFVGFDNRSAETSDVPPGSIHTLEDRAGEVAYRTRNHSGPGTATITVRKPIVCSDCLKAGAELVGYGDRVPLLADIDQLNARIADLQKQLEQSEQQRQDADAAVLSLRALDRFLPDVSGDRPSLQVEIADLKRQLLALRQDFERTEPRRPRADNPDTGSASRSRRSRPKEA